MTRRMPDLFGFCCLLIFLAACSASNNGVKVGRDFERFPAESVQVETKLMETGLSTPASMIIYRDSLLLVVNNLNRNPYHVRVFDIEQRKAINNIFPVSRKYGGALSFMSFKVTDSLVWVFDVAKNGFIVGNIDSVGRRTNSVEDYFEYRLQPQIWYYDALFLNRQEAFFSGNYDTDEKLAYINFADSTRNKTLLFYEKDTNIGSSRVNKMAYESFMMIRPDKKKLVLACRYADQVELLDLQSGNYRKIRGPVGFPPRLVPFKNNADVTVATHGNETVYSFLNGHVSDNYFYLLFSGYSVKSQHRFYGNKIFVYDWEGNPVKQINLKKDIIDFVVSSDDKTLYTLNPQTKDVSISDIKW